MAAGSGLATQFSPDAFAAHPQWKAGLAQVIITPQKPLWMAGYAARTKPSEGTYQELYAKALALEDHAGKRAVLVTSDLLGFPAAVSHNIFEQVEKRHHLRRDQLLLSSSHTHTGPVIGKMLQVAYPMNAQQWADVEAYTSELESKIVKLMGTALKSLRPARLSFGHGEAGFAKNRRGRTNDVFAYIPSLRVLQEGGYEGGGAMIYYGQPGPFAPSVEETIIGKVHDLIPRVRSESP